MSAPALQRQDQRLVRSVGEKSAHKFETAAHNSHCYQLPMLSQRYWQPLIEFYYCQRAQQLVHV